MRHNALHANQRTIAQPGSIRLAVSAVIEDLFHRERIPGLAVAALIAIAAILLGPIAWLGRHGLSALTVAILIGIIVGNGPYGRIAARCGPGVSYSKQTLLRAGVVLYGLRLTFADIQAVGITGVLIDALVLGSTFVLAWYAGTRLLHMDAATVMLVGAGSAICGAAAVMATEPVVRGKSEQVTVAVATVVVFGTIGIFLYPALFAANLHYGLVPMDDRGFGIYIGSTVHEVAQVFAAGRSVSVQTADTAVITKMVRVMMLAPFLILLSATLGRMGHHKQHHDNTRSTQITIPWFAVAFCCMVVMNSLITIPAGLRSLLLSIDTLLLCIAMAALGLTTHLSSIQRAGFKPLILSTLLFGWLVIGGGLINHLVPTCMIGM